MRSANSSPSRGAREPEGLLRKLAFKLVMSRPFEFFVMGVIVLNVIGMALDYHRIEEDEVYYHHYTVAMLGFTYFYYAEFLLKWFAMGNRYFGDSWCRAIRRAPAKT